MKSLVVTNNFVMVPSYAAAPASTTTLLQSRSVTQQQTSSSDARTPPTNSITHAAPNTHHSPGQRIICKFLQNVRTLLAITCQNLVNFIGTSAGRRLVEKDSRPPSATLTVGIPATGHSSRQASMNDNQVTKNNVDASENLDDSPRKRLQKEESENSQFLQHLVEMVRAAAKGKSINNVTMITPFLPPHLVVLVMNLPDLPYVLMT